MPTLDPQAEFLRLLQKGQRLARTANREAATLVLKEEISEKWGFGGKVADGLAEEILNGEPTTFLKLAGGDSAPTIQTEPRLVAKAAPTPALRILLKSQSDYVLYGPASIAIVDDENELVTGAALKAALPQLITRGLLSLQHIDIAPGRILESYATPDGRTFKTEVRPVTTEDIATFPKLKGVEEGTEALFIVAKLYQDNQYSLDTIQKIERGEIGSLSISGQAVKEKSRMICDKNSLQCKLVNVIEKLDLSATTLCRRGMNPHATFKVISKTGECKDCQVPEVVLMSKEEVEAHDAVVKAESMLAKSADPNLRHCLNELYTRHPYLKAAPMPPPPPPPPPPAMKGEEVNPAATTHDGCTCQGCPGASKPPNEPVVAIVAQPAPNAGPANPSPVLAPPADSAPPPVAPEAAPAPVPPPAEAGPSLPEEKPEPDEKPVKSEKDDEPDEDEELDDKEKAVKKSVSHRLLDIELDMLEKAFPPKEAEAKGLSVGYPQRPSHNGVYRSPSKYASTKPPGELLDYTYPAGSDRARDSANKDPRVGKRPRGFGGDVVVKAAFCAQCGEMECNAEGKYDKNAGAMLQKGKLTITYEDSPAPATDLDKARKPNYDKMVEEADELAYQARNEIVPERRAELEARSKKLHGRVMGDIKDKTVVEEPDEGHQHSDCQCNGDATKCVCYGEGEDMDFVEEKAWGRQPPKQHVGMSNPDADWDDKARSGPGRAAPRDPYRGRSGKTGTGYDKDMYRARERAMSDLYGAPEQKAAAPPALRELAARYGTVSAMTREEQEDLRKPAAPMISTKSPEDDMPPEMPPDDELVEEEMLDGEVPSALPEEGAPPMDLPPEEQAPMGQDAPLVANETPYENELPEPQQDETDDVIIAGPDDDRADTDMDIEERLDRVGKSLGYEEPALPALMKAYGFVEKRAGSYKRDESLLRLANTPGAPVRITVHPKAPEQKASPELKNMEERAERNAAAQDVIPEEDLVQKPVGKCADHAEEAYCFKCEPTEVFRMHSPLMAKALAQEAVQCQAPDRDGCRDPAEHAHKVVFGVLGRQAFRKEYNRNCVQCFSLFKHYNDPELYFETLNHHLMKGWSRDGVLTLRDQATLKKEWSLMREQLSRWTNQTPVQGE